MDIRVITRKGATCEKWLIRREHETFVAFLREMRYLHLFIIYIQSGRKVETRYRDSEMLI